jgi:hypothetical protein
MARKVEVKLVDDIDGGEAGETLTFSLDDTNYEIDVSSKHADDLRANLWPFISKARKIGRGGVATPRRAADTTLARSDRAQNKAIRDWAKRKNIELSDRGRIPRSIVEQYEAEAGR